MIVAEAGLDAASITWEGTPRAIWASVLQDERNQERVGAVFRSLSTHYPENDDFWAAGMAYIQSVERSRRQPTLADMGDKQDHVATLLEQWGANLSQQIQSVRNDIQGVTRRIDNLEQKFETRLGVVEGTLSMVYVVTPFRRLAWVLGFLLFALPCVLFIEEVRRAANVSVQVTATIFVMAWTGSLVLFLYGLGFIKDSQ